MAGTVFDLNGQKHGNTDSNTVDLNYTTYVDEMKATALVVDSTSGKTNYVNMGRFDFECISDPDRCDPDGVTVSMFIMIHSSYIGTVVCLATSEKNGRGIIVKYITSEKRLYVQVFTKTKNFSSYAVVEQSKWQHVAFAFSKNMLKSLYGSVDVGFYSTGTKSATLQDKYTTLYLGYYGDRTGSAKAYVSNLAIWKTEKAFDNIRRVLACSSTKTG